jgi:hypothetical protein
LILIEPTTRQESFEGGVPERERAHVPALDVPVSVSQSFDGRRPNLDRRWCASLSLARQLQPHG